MEEIKDRRGLTERQTGLPEHSGNTAPSNSAVWTHLRDVGVLTLTRRCLTQTCVCDVASAF